MEYHILNKISYYINKEHSIQNKNLYIDRSNIIIKTSKGLIVIDPLLPQSENQEDIKDFANIKLLDKLL